MNFYLKIKNINKKYIEVKYGCNPNQKPAKIFMKEGKLPIKIINGRAGYINLLDALNAWQLVKELKYATGIPATTSFKHVSPAGAAVGIPLTDIERKMYWVDNEMELAQLANAYIRARGSDRMSSYGDFIALSDVCDIETARIIKNEFSHGVIAPSYEPEALVILRHKKKGEYCIIQIDEDYIPCDVEQKDVFGITFEQGRNDTLINDELFKNIVTKNKIVSEQAKLDLTVAMITLKYTQSNSVCFAKDGQVIGVGAGQQSRIHCTRLAGQKADNWFLRKNPKVLDLSFKDNIKRSDRDNCVDIYISDDSLDILREENWRRFFTTKPKSFTSEERELWLKNMTGVSLVSDAFFPFDDNIIRAYKSGVKYIAQSGGSTRDDRIIDACDKYNMVMCFTGIRLFHH